MLRYSKFVARCYTTAPLMGILAAATALIMGKLIPKVEPRWIASYGIGGPGGHVFHAGTHLIGRFHVGCRHHARAGYERSGIPNNPSERERLKVILGEQPGSSAKGMCEVFGDPRMWLTASSN